MNMFTSRSLFLITRCALATAVLLPIVSLAQATTSATTSTTTAVVPVVETTPLPTAAPAALSPLAQTRILNLAANMSNRMDSAVKRLQNVHDRLDSRLTKVALTGADVTNARTVLEEAQKHLDTARSNLLGIDTTVEGFLSSSNPQENWLEAKQFYNVTADEIIAAHTAIKMSLTATEQAMITPMTPAGSTTISSSTSSSTPIQ